MTKPQDANLTNPEELMSVMHDIAERSKVLVEDFVSRQSAEGGQVAVPATMQAMSQAFIDLTSRMMANPADVMQAQFGLWNDYLQLWQSTAQRMVGQGGDAVVAPERGDRRFKDEAWSENPLFDYIKQSYLLSSRFVMAQAAQGEGTDPKQQAKIEFYAKQFVDALAPSNFVATNPEVLRVTMESNGENLVKGLQNMLDDLERGKGKLKIKMTDLDAFEIGENIATTPGQVVYQNDLMQLVQYTPVTEEAHKLPLMIIPPWINKFYILDLQPKNSFIKFALEQGFTVFVLSWVNPDEQLSHKSFEDYMLEGPLAALDAIQQATGSKDVTVIGYCLGGTLLSATLAYMAVKKDNRIKAATFFTTMVDFTEPGELGVFIDEEQLASLEETMAKQGVLDGGEMATTFNMLRANDLIWSFVVNNYLLGKDPFPFDLLYWNSDSTCMPATMHSFYLRKFYHENQLIEPGAIVMDGVPIDLRKVRIPCYWVSTKEDHIAPWKSTYATTQIFKGQKRFVLAGSGHIAGVINPPASGKYGYWTNAALPPTPEAWQETAKQHDGSWWTDWAEWNAAKAGAKVPACKPGDHDLAIIEPAPGSYVKKRAV